MKSLQKLVFRVLTDKECIGKSDKEMNSANDSGTKDGIESSCEILRGGT